jgi:flavin reductase (DIM6/NTAB) family NADH-FMN oxidoreductase RutF
MEQKAVVAADTGWAERNIRDFRGSPVGRICDEWMLISAGNTAGGAGNWNTMTASWGALGELWGRDVATIYVRPGRRTVEFLNANPLFTLSFFDQKYLSG